MSTATATVQRERRRQSPPGRRVVAGCLVALLVLVLGWVFRPVTPRLGEQATGDEQLIAAIREANPAARNLSVALVEADGSTRSAYFGDAGPDRRYEIGSVSKALTGLVMADEVGRGELDLAAPAEQYLPELADTDAGAATGTSLVTHTSGLPRLAPGVGTLARGWLSLLWPIDPYPQSRADLLGEAAGASTGNREYAYSNLGAAVAGQVAASAAGTDYPTLMRERLFIPVGMPDTEVQVAARPVPDGFSGGGRREPPWVMDGYAPTGGIVSTPRDLTTLVTALLTGTAPGMSALDPVESRSEESESRTGVFWVTTPYGVVLGDGTAGRFTWHNGMTGGYSSFVGIDRERGRSVILLSDVAAAEDDLAIRLLHDPPTGG